MIVLDSSVLINFLRIDRMDLLRQLSYEFAITTHVEEEISDHYREQKRRLSEAVNNGTLSEFSVDRPYEPSLFTAFAASGRLGARECSAFAAAISRSYDLTLGDTRARRDALAFQPELKVLGTEDLIVLAIEENVLTIAESDEIKALWESEHRFKLNFNSFAELFQ